MSTAECSDFILRYPYKGQVSIYVVAEVDQFLVLANVTAGRGHAS